MLEITALLVFIAGIFLLLEFLFRDYKNAVDFVMDDFFARRDKAETLLVGNSHSLPLYFSLKENGDQQTACMTIGGDDLFWMQALVKRHLKEMPQVKQVILNCDDELLGFNQSLSGLQYMNRILYPYADTMYGNKTSDIVLSKSNFFRSNRDMGYLFHQPANAKMMITNRDGGSVFTEDECKNRAEEISEKRFQRKLFQENLSYLTSIINEVKRWNKKLYILRMPKCDCLRASVVQTNLDASRKLTDSLFNASGVEILDFTNDTSFQRSDYGNPDHLTTEAAGRLLEKINIRTKEGLSGLNK